MHGGDRVAWNDHPDQVERVRGVDHHCLAASICPAHPAQSLDGFWKCVLLSLKTGDKPSAPDEATVLQAAQSPLDLTPRQTREIVDGERAEQHPPTVEKLLGDRLSAIMGVQGTGVTAWAGH